jgi:hypothetical protein
LLELAESRGQDVAAFAKTVLEDYLDLEDLPLDSEEDWAEASHEPGRRSSGRRRLEWRP